MKKLKFVQTVLLYNLVANSAHSADIAGSHLKSCNNCNMSSYKGSTIRQYTCSCQRKDGTYTGTSVVLSSALDPSCNILSNCDGKFVCGNSCALEAITKSDELLKKAKIAADQKIMDIYNNMGSIAAQLENKINYLNTQVTAIGIDRLPQGVDTRATSPIVALGQKITNDTKSYIDMMRQRVQDIRNIRDKFWLDEASRKDLEAARPKAVVPPLVIPHGGKY